MKIHAHIKLGFVIGLLTLAHLQTKQGSIAGVFDPDIVATVVLVVMGSIVFGKPNEKNKEKESPFLEAKDDYDLTA